MIRMLRFHSRRALTLLVLLAILAACLAPASLAQGAAAPAQSSDRLRVAPGPVAVRENPSNGSVKVRSLKAGQKVRIDYEADGWVAVFPPEQKNRAESSALGYVRLGDLRLAGPLDLRRDGAAPEKDKGKDEARAAAPAEKEKEKDKRKADKPKTAAEKKREAKEAKETKAALEKARKDAKETKAALEKARKDAKALKTSPKSALTRDELLATPQQKATVRTSSVVVEKAVDKAAEPKAPDAKPVDAKHVDAKPADSKPVDAKSAEVKSSDAAARLADQKAAQAQAPASKPMPRPAPPKEEDFGVIRVPDRPLAVRAARNKDSEFRKLLQPGQRVRTDMQADGFYAVFAPEERVRDIKRAWGYGRDKYLLTEKEFAARGAAYPPTTAPAAPQPEARPEAKIETKMEAKAPAPEPRKFVPSRVEPAPAVELAPKPEARPLPEPRPVQAAQAAAAPANGVSATAPASPGEEVVGYALIERREDPLRPLAPVLVRVRLDTAAAPAQEALRRVVREIWRAERRKADEVLMEVYLTGMDSTSLAYAVARFGPDGRIRELHWRDSLVPKKR